MHWCFPVKSNYNTTVVRSADGETLSVVLSYNLLHIPIQNNNQKCKKHVYRMGYIFTYIPLIIMICV